MSTSKLYSRYLRRSESLKHARSKVAYYQKKSGPFSKRRLKFWKRRTAKLKKIIDGYKRDSRITLYDFAVTARDKYGLTVHEFGPGVGYGFPGFPDPVDNVHSSNSLHYEGRAFDAFGTKMNEFANYLQTKKAKEITQLIHNGNKAYSVLNGEIVDHSVWGSETWNAHKSHVHVGKI